MLLLLATLAAADPGIDCSKTDIQPSMQPELAERLYLGLVQSVDAATDVATLQTIHASRGEVAERVTLPEPATCDDLGQLAVGQLIIVVENEGRAPRSRGSAVLDPSHYHYAHMLLGEGQPLPISLLTAVSDAELPAITPTDLQMIYPTLAGQTVPIRGESRPIVEQRDPNTWASEIVGWRYGEHALVRYLGHHGPSGCSLGSAMSLWRLGDQPVRLWRLNTPVHEPAICVSPAGLAQE